MAEKNAPEAVVKRQPHHCPYCDEAIQQAKLPWCQACGVKLAYCSQCGQAVASDLTVCPHCGKQLSFK